MLAAFARRRIPLLSALKVLIEGDVRMPTFTTVRQSLAQVPTREPEARVMTMTAGKLRQLMLHAEMHNHPFDTSGTLWWQYSMKLPLESVDVGPVLWEAMARALCGCPPLPTIDDLPIAANFRNADTNTHLRGKFSS